MGGRAEPSAWVRHGLIAIMFAAVTSGCGFYGYGGSAITKGGDVSAAGHPADGGDVSVNVYALDIGGVKNFGPLFVESGLWSAWSRVALRSGDESSISFDGHPDSVFYVGGGLGLGGERTVAAAYGRYGIAIIQSASGNVTESLLELGIEVCPGTSGKKVKFSWCGRAGLMVQSGTAIPLDDTGDYTGVGPVVWFGPRWEWPER